MIFFPKINKWLPKLRLIFFCLAFVHLVTIMLVMLSIDFTVSEIPELRAYEHLRWKLITTWFNLVMFVYFPLCIYCEWWEIHNGGICAALRTLNNIRDVIFTSILLPTTLFGDLLFWRLYVKNKYLLMPVGTEDEVPFWTQHSLHTVSLGVVLLDLILTPRQRPRSLMPGLAITVTFVSCYAAMCWYSRINEIYVYPFIGNLTNTEVLIFITYMILEHCAYYFAQWPIIDLIWNQKSSKNQWEIKISYEEKKKN